MWPGELFLLPQRQTSDMASVSSHLFSGSQSVVDESVSVHLSFPDFFTAFVSKRRRPLFFFQCFPMVPSNLSLYDLGLVFIVPFSKWGFSVLERNNNNKSFLSSLRVYLPFSFKVFHQVSYSFSPLAAPDKTLEAAAGFSICRCSC